MPKHPLRRWRESHDQTVTLTQLAGKIGSGIDAPQISRIELYKVEPSLRTACRLEEITGLHPRTFLRPAETAQEQVNG